MIKMKNDLKKTETTEEASVETEGKQNREL